MKKFGIEMVATEGLGTDLRMQRILNSDLSARQMRAEVRKLKYHFSQRCQVQGFICIEFLDLI